MAWLEDLLLILRHQVDSVIDVFLLHNDAIDAFIRSQRISRVDLRLLDFLFVKQIGQPGDVLILQQ